MADARPWRHLYKTSRWRRMREAHFARHPLCVYCLRVDDVSEATVLDHIKPHKGDEVLFWDDDNVQGLCKACHDGLKQREERGQEVVRFGADGWPLD